MRLFSYDSAGRLSSIRQSIDGGALETIETDAYDAIGRLSSRTFGQNGLLSLRTSLHSCKCPEQSLSLQRMGTSDPLQQKYLDISPYAYCAGDPVNLVDVDGKEIVISNTGNIIHNFGKDKKVFVSNSGVYSYIGDIDGMIEATPLIDNLFREHSRIAKRMNPFSLRALVRNKGIWDLKSNMATIWGLANNTDTRFRYNDEILTSQDVGNMHFGVVAESNIYIPQWFALQQAGDAQIKAGTSKREWRKYTSIRIGISNLPFVIMLPPYGDDPKDQEMIVKGFKWFEKNEK